MKIFLDIGSHMGQTLREVTKEKYAFDKIVGFEPSSFCLDELKKIAAEDDRIEICKFGLSNRNEDIQLFQAGTQAGSIYKDEDYSVDKEEVETIKLCDACEWFESNTSADDYVVVKTNCEGSEVDILDSLMDGNIMKNIYCFLITFDIRNYEKSQHREVEIRKRLKKEKLTNFCFSDNVMIGISHEQRIENWLTLFGIDSPSKDLDFLKKLHKKEFLKYSSKNGFFSRWEVRLKRIFNYNNFPDWIKDILKLFKRVLRLNRER
jgi:FkbM family methyltransferase